jgi:hypothetical protein
VSKIFTCIRILNTNICQNVSLQRRLVNWARLGELNIYSDSIPVDYEIVERVMHPKYNPAYVYNDIALFRLGEEVKFTAYIRPVCLNTVQKFRFNIATAIGWGRTSNGKY